MMANAPSNRQVWQMAACPLDAPWQIHPESRMQLVLGKPQVYSSAAHL